MNGIGGGFAETKREVSRGFGFQHKFAAELPQSGLPGLQRGEQPLQEDSGELLDGLGMGRGFFEKVGDFEFRGGPAGGDQLVPFSPKLGKPKIQLRAEAGGKSVAIQLGDLLNRFQSQAVKPGEIDFGQPQPFEGQCAEQIGSAGREDGGLVRLRQEARGGPGGADGIGDGESRLISLFGELAIDALRQRRFAAEQRRNARDVQKEAFGVLGLFQPDAGAVPLAADGEREEGGSIGVGLHRFHDDDVPRTDQSPRFRRRHAGGDSSAAGRLVNAAHGVATSSAGRDQQHGTAQLRPGDQASLDGPVGKPQAQNS